MSQPTVAAIVVSFNRRPLLQECLTALLGQSRPPDRVYVVDNASTDGSREYLLGLAKQHAQVEVILLNDNLGGAGGFSTGLRAAFGQGFGWYWLMDDDAEPMPDALEHLLNSKKAADTGVVALCGTVFDEARRTQLWHQGEFDTRMRLRASTQEQHDEPVFSTSYMSFVGALIRHDAIRRVGFPAAEYFIWNDDVEYSARLSKIGAMHCITTCRMIHKDGVPHAQRSTTRSIAAWASNRRIPSAAQWKYACGMRNYVHMVFRHRKRALVWSSLLFAKRLARIMIFGERNPTVIKLYVNYYFQAIGRRDFHTIRPADWKKMID